jgi:hypothetical protein
MASYNSPIGVLDLQVTANAGQTITVGGELSAGVVTGMQVFGDDGVIASLSKNGNSVLTATYNVIGGDNTIGSVLNNLVNTPFNTSDSLTVAISGAPARRVVIYIRYPDAYSWVITTSVA